MAPSLGTTEVEVPAGPFSFYKALLAPPLSPTHTHTALNTHLRRMGKAHSRPSGRSDATGTLIPQSYTPLSSLVSTSSPSPLSCGLRPAHVIGQTVSCCITHTPLCPLSAALRAMFPDVASKLGHEHDTRRDRKGWRRSKALCIFTLRCFLNLKQIDHYICCCLSDR